MPQGTWVNGVRINNVDATPNALAACWFQYQFYLFWRANDGSDQIYYSALPEGQNCWPSGRPINNVDRTSDAPAACVFQNNLYLFWRANDGSDRIYFTASPDGQLWPSGQTISDVDTTPSAVAACDYADPLSDYEHSLHLFWRTHGSNRIYYTQGDGVEWQEGAPINDVDSTSDALAACVFQDRIYLFWRANDPSNRIFYSTSNLSWAAWPFLNGTPINNVDTTPKGLACSVAPDRIVLFWKANDPSDRIYFTISTDGQTWPNGQRINDVDSTPEAPAGGLIVQMEIERYAYVFWKANDPSNAIYWSVGPIAPAPP